MAQRRPTLPQPTRSLGVRNVRTTAALAFLAVAFVAAGCGGGHKAAGTTAATTSTVRADPQKRLTAAVQDTPRANHRLGEVVVLRHPSPGSGPNSTRRPPP